METLRDPVRRAQVRSWGRREFTGAGQVTVAGQTNTVTALWELSIVMTGGQFWGEKKDWAINRTEFRRHVMETSVKVVAQCGDWAFKKWRPSLNPKPLCLFSSTGIYRVREGLLILVPLRGNSVPSSPSGPGLQECLSLLRGQ